jgi:hypothetical protein
LWFFELPWSSSISIGESRFFSLCFIFLLFLVCFLLISRKLYEIRILMYLSKVSELNLI